jgi:hypothetical protein
VNGSLAEIEQMIANGTATGLDLGAILQSLISGTNTTTVPSGDNLGTGECQFTSTGQPRSLHDLTAAIEDFLL